MKARRTADSNITLTLPGGGPERDLPAQRLLVFDPELGETEANARPAFETVWIPDEGERRALANGAPIRLVITGSNHPPVSMSIGEPEELEALVSKKHVDRAVGFWYAKLAQLLAEGKGFPSAPETLELWHEALEQTRREDPEAPTLEAELAEVEEQLRKDPPDGPPAP